MSETESRLIERAKEADSDAFAEIYDRHQPAIYRYIYFQVGDAAVAEDLTSEVFVRLVEKIDSFIYRGRPLLAWLYTIARNLITDHRRRVGRTSSLPLDDGEVADTISPEDFAAHSLTQESLITAIAHLAESQRQVIVLKFIEGLDNQTVAEVLGKSIGAVKSLQHRALVELREILARNRD